MSMRRSEKSCAIRTSASQIAVAVRMVLAHHVADDARGLTYFLSGV